MILFYHSENDTEHITKFRISITVSTRNESSTYNYIPSSIISLPVASVISVLCNDECVPLINEFFHAVVIEKGTLLQSTETSPQSDTVLSEKQDDLIVQLHHRVATEIFITRVISAHVSAKPDRENIAKAVYPENITRQIALFCRIFCLRIQAHAMT